MLSQLYETYHSCMSSLVSIFSQRGKAKRSVFPTTGAFNAAYANSFADFKSVFRQSTLRRNLRKEDKERVSPCRSIIEVNFFLATSIVWKLFSVQIPVRK